MKNIISIIGCFLFLIIFSFFYSQEYLGFHTENKAILQNIEYLEEQKENFSLSEIKTIPDLELYQMPDKKFLEQIVSEIDNAENKIYLETYILTETRIQEALKRAYKRNLDVKVLLEENPYMAYNINNKAVTNLQKSGIEIAWSDSEDYSLNHSKFIIIDDFAYISTGNFSYSTFTSNRDYYIKVDKEDIIKKLNEVFLADYSGNEKNFYHPNLVLSPYNSRDVFEKLLLGAKESVDMYAQYFSDEEIENLLIQTAKRGIKLRIIMRKPNDNSDEELINKMKKNGIQIEILTYPNMHSKMFLVDQEYLFLGSVNLSSYSIDRNRELGLLIKNPEIIAKIQSYFEKDLEKINSKK